MPARIRRVRAAVEAVTGPTPRARAPRFSVLAHAWTRSRTALIAASVATPARPVGPVRQARARVRLDSRPAMAHAWMSVRIRTTAVRVARPARPPRAAWAVSARARLATQPVRPGAPTRRQIQPTVVDAGWCVQRTRCARSGSARRPARRVSTNVGRVVWTFKATLCTVASATCPALPARFAPVGPVPVPWG